MNYAAIVAWPHVLGMAATGMAGRLPPPFHYRGIGSIGVPLYRLLQNSAFEPDHIEAMAAAFEDACRELGLAERTDVLRDTVALKVIELAQRGERDPERLKQQVLSEFKG